MHTITKFLSPLTLAIDRSIASTEIIKHTYIGAFTEMIAEIKMTVDSWDYIRIDQDDETYYDVWGTMDGNDFRLTIQCVFEEYLPKSKR